VKDKVKVLKYTDKIVKCGTECYKIPAVIRLIQLVRSIYRSKVPFTKKNIMIRDGYRCVYCGTSDNLTIDHIIPQSRGGKTDFENCTTSCRVCNNKKGSRTPNEAHMPMHKKAYQPTIAEFLMIKLRNLGIDSVLRDLGIY
jgi:5-methylcytosine-specific restriction endonuclease McrA